MAVAVETGVAGAGGTGSRFGITEIISISVCILVATSRWAWAIDCPPIPRDGVMVSKTSTVASTADTFDKVFYLMKLSKEERKDVVDTREQVPNDLKFEQILYTFMLQC